VLQQAIQQAWLLLVLLEDVTHTVFDLLEGERFECFLPDLRVRPNPFMHKMLGDVLDVLNEHSLLRNEEIGVLGHAFIDVVVLWKHPISDDLLIAGEGLILEVLVDLLQIEEFRLHAESHSDANAK
jgi:hypothetical protein